ncbi:hypothetical protein EDB81DRAFT_118939 [Dactylonectria macrodidyma]|uniref:Uncharacterized protein n=1 Tax=Dactylonectria macrodidyma TaxID=307937 RepID=A0A9P9E818_9HYPO|nr:hypothetical protein EDB81DRAFT_118939 [Dactylonectria macrodidyma]
MTSQGGQDQLDESVMNSPTAPQQSPTHPLTESNLLQFNNLNDDNSKAAVPESSYYSVASYMLSIRESSEHAERPDINDPAGTLKTLFASPFLKEDPDTQEPSGIRYFQQSPETKFENPGKEGWHDIFRSSPSQLASAYINTGLSMEMQSLHEFIHKHGPAILGKRLQVEMDHLEGFTEEERQRLPDLLIAKVMAMMEQNMRAQIAESPAAAK